MFNYQRLKKKYEKLYNKTIEDNKEILIESFVEYYGEKHRDEIVSRFNEITFVYFINWEVFSDILKIVSIVKASVKKEYAIKFKDFKDFLKYKKKTNNTFKDYFIGSSNMKIIKEEIIDGYPVKKILGEIFNKGNPNYNNVLLKNQFCRLICLPILIVSEKDIIHEINHAITSYSIMINQTKMEFIDKSGLQVFDKDINIGELINERASLEIYEIFKRRGGNLSEINLTTLENYYTRNLYLIDEFYNKFKEIIKESLITLNKNNLVQRVGKENYEELVNIVNKYYVADLHLPEKNKKESKRDREKIVQRMQNKVINTENLTKRDLEEYYMQLEQEGKKVRILNELPENSEEEKKSYHF